MRPQMSPLMKTMWMILGASIYSFTVYNVGFKEGRDVTYNAGLEKGWKIALTSCYKTIHQTCPAALVPVDADIEKYLRNPFNDLTVTALEKMSVKAQKADDIFKADDELVEAVRVMDENDRKRR